MFSTISNTWADLFKRNNSKIIENSSPQCLHEISNDWICVDDQQNCETVDDLKKHEFLTPEQKDRRAQWQKRIKKGRSNKYNSMPSKAKILRKNSNASPVNNKSENNNNNSSKVQSNTTSNHQQAQLRAKLRLAVEQAGCSNSEQETTNNNHTNFPNPNYKPKQAKPVKNNNYNLRSGARKMPIQQPSQRGMN